MVLLTETWPLRMILLAAKASGDSLQQASHPSAHRARAPLFQEHPVAFSTGSRCSVLLPVTHQQLPECPWAFLMKPMAKHKCVCPTLHGDTHNHVIFGRAALWLHRNHLNRVALFFCCCSSVQIHQAHALLPYESPLGWKLDSCLICKSAEEHVFLV